MSTRLDRNPADLGDDPPDMDHGTTIPVLGIPVRFASNDRAVIEVVESAFSAWRVLDDGGATIESGAARVTITVEPVESGTGERVRMRYRVLDGHRVLFAGDGNLAVVEPALRESAAWVTPDFVRDVQHFRYGLVEAITMALITTLDRQPFHAACLVRDGAAVLLTGPSGVGKSSLSWAAIRHLSGVAVLAEDAVYLQSRPQLRIWGLPGFVHVPPDAVRAFPELAGASPVVLANGKTKIAIDVRNASAAAPVPFVDRASICVLRRGRSGPALTRVDGDALLGELLTGLEQGFDLFADTIAEPLRMLTRRGGWRLDLPPNPMDALPWIDRILRDLESETA